MTPATPGAAGPGPEDRRTANARAAEGGSAVPRTTPGAEVPLLSVRDLSVRFLLRGREQGGRRARRGDVTEIAAVTDVSFDLAPGECLALVGESGCGKSVLASALLGLLPANTRTSGSAVLAGGGAGDPGTDLLSAGERALSRTVRGRRIGLVPQSPAAHLTAVRTVRAQLEETVHELAGIARRDRHTLNVAVRAAAERAAFPADHLDAYPHQLSGGLAQRAATALALVGDAPLLVADEPTTGLDRDLIARTVDELRQHTADGRGLLIITHDLRAAERVADRTAVMYAGRVVELTGSRAFFGTPGPRHPYAHGLLDALPERGFVPVPGRPPELGALPDGCAFAPRCERADSRCGAVPEPVGGAACHHPLHDEAPKNGQDPAEATHARTA